MSRTATLNGSPNNFEAGIEFALRAMLVDPDFLFFVERDPAGAAPGSLYRVSDLQLASRLSLFLWSSIPDDELLTLAEQKRLSDPGVLGRQVERMLGDPRASALVGNFAGQWLHLRNMRQRHAGSRGVPRVRRKSPRRAAAGNRAVHPAPAPRGPQCRRAADGRLHVPERTPGAGTTASPDIWGTAVPPRPGRRSGPPRTARPGQHPDGHVVCEPDVADAARQMGAREPPRRAAAGAAAQRSEPGRRCRDGRPVGARADGAASPQRRVRQLPRARWIRSGWRWRTSTRSASGGRATARPRSTHRPACRTAARSKAPPACGSCSPIEPDRFAAAITEKLLTYALGRGVEYHDRPGHPPYRARRGARRLHAGRRSSTGIVRSTPFQMRRASES